MSRKPMPFYNRKKELAQLNEKYASLRNGEFGVVYGRRRIGKTKLLQHFLGQITGGRLYINVTDTDANRFKEHLSERIEEAFGDIVRVADWGVFFDYLAEKSRADKLVVILDEFQRIRSFSKDFILKLQEFCDTMLPDCRLLLIICGSSMSMMHRLVLEQNGPLYGRTTFRLPLRQFTYSDLRGMFPVGGDERVSIYALYGGTPKYLIDYKLTNSRPLDAYERLVVDETGPLFEEPINALKFELKSPNRYLSIVRAIASGKVLAKDIADHIGLTTRQISPYLETLIYLLDIVEQADPLFGKKKQRRYLLKDNFYWFWFRYIYPKMESLLIGGWDEVRKGIEEDLSTFCGRIFEKIVREFFITQQGKTIKGKTIRFSRCGSWWDGAGEIDLILAGSEETVFVDVKFTRAPVTRVQFETLKRRSMKTKASGKFHYIMISKSGFAEDLRPSGNLTLLTIEEMEEMLDGTSG